MNPVLASGLLKIGGDLVSRAIPSPQDDLSVNRSFENELKDVQATRTENVNLNQLQRKFWISRNSNFIHKTKTPQSLLTNYLTVRSGFLPQPGIS